MTPTSIAIWAASVASVGLIVTFSKAAWDVRSAPNKQALRANVALSDLVLPPATRDSKQVSELRRYSKLLTVNIENVGKIPASEVEVVIPKGAFLYSIEGAEAIESVESAAAIGDIKVSQSVVVHIWCEPEVDTSKVTVSYKESSITFNPRANKARWSY